jgi:hypothetical protein
MADALCQPPCFGVFYTYCYNHGRRLRLEKLLYLELSGSPNGFFEDSGHITLSVPLFREAPAGPVNYYRGELG